MTNIEAHKIPETLMLRFESDALDLLSVGVLAYHLHSVLNQVAITMFQMHDERAKLDGTPPLLPFIPQSYNREDRLVSARITALRQGSIEMDLAGLVTAVFSQPGAVAVVHNLFSSAVWAIGAYAARIPGVKVYRGDTQKHIEGKEAAMLSDLLRPVAGRKRLKPRIDRFIELLAESSNGGNLTLKSGDTELRIEFYGKANEKQG